VDGVDGFLDVGDEWDDRGEVFDGPSGWAGGFELSLHFSFVHASYNDAELKVKCREAKSHGTNLQTRADWFRHSATLPLSHHRLHLESTL